MNLPARLLQRLAPWREAPAWIVAFSGGLDSTVLLHALAGLRTVEGLAPIRAVHIHHGLQVHADEWVVHCQRFCQNLGVPLTVLHVSVESGASIEQAARNARYAAFTQCLGVGDVLLTGQHQDDQAETFLFRALRGAGVNGLAAMPLLRPLGCGLLVRPLLTFSKQELRAYAQQHQLSWVEDPSNQSDRYDRNYLRGQVMPSLSARWPQVARAFARSAGHMREAQGLLEDLASIDLAQLARWPSPWPWLEVPSLPLAPLLELTESRQTNLLRYWLLNKTLMPDSGHWQGWRDLRDAAPDAMPSWQLAGGQLRRESGRVWWLSDDWSQCPQAVNITGLEAGQYVALLGNGAAWISGATLPKGAWRIAYRQGGEVVNVPGRGRRDLKRLLNEAALPIFTRARLPLLYSAEQLVAVANLNVSTIEGLQLHWRP